MRGSPNGSLDERKFVKKYLSLFWLGMRRLKLERSNTFAFRKSLRREKAEKKQQTKRKNALHENPRHDSRSGSFDEEIIALSQIWWQVSVILVRNIVSERIKRKC